jgi:hypothetical protein
MIDRFYGTLLAAFLVCLVGGTVMPAPDAGCTAYWYETGPNDPPTTYDRCWLSGGSGLHRGALYGRLDAGWSSHRDGVRLLEHDVPQVPRHVRLAQHDAQSGTPHRQCTDQSQRLALYRLPVSDRMPARVIAQ